MNLHDTSAFEIEPRANGVLWLWSDMPLADDGQLARVIATPLSGGYWRLSDGATVLMHASSFGTEVDARKAKSLSRLMPRGVMLNDAGEIVAEPVSEAGLIDFALRHLSGQLVLSHAISHNGQPSRDRFENTLGHLLEATFGDQRVTRRPRVSGASGHSIEIPFMLTLEAGRPLLMQYVSRKQNGKYDWSGIYSTVGRCADLRLAGYGDDQRLVVVEDLDVDKDELGSVTTALAEAATVLRFSSSPEWSRSLMRH